MCGIIGAVSASVTTLITPMEIARDRMRERGPDDAGLHQIGAALFGFRRLAILDLTPAGHQPMVSADGQVMLVFNGEIYNYQDLRHQLKADYNFRSESDTEVILSAYLAWGWERMLDHIDGMFGIAIWDNRTQTLYAARDRVGKKPFFYHHDADGLKFSSTLNALRGLLPLQPAVNPIALDAYLTYQAVPAPLSIFQGIDQLPPAHYLVYQHTTRRLTVERYWDVRYDEKLDQSENAILETMEQLVRQAVQRRLVSDVPLGAFLSGGVDSSLVVAMMAQEKSEPIDAIVIGFDDPTVDERCYARQVVQHLGRDRVNLHEHVLKADVVQNLPEIIWQYGQPLADVSIVPTYYVAKAAREHVTVALNGDGGDELFGGYARPMVARTAEQYRRFVPAPLRGLVADLFSHGHPRALRKVAMLARAGKGTAQENFIYDRALRAYREQLYSPELLEQLAHHPDHLYHQVWARAQATDDVDRALYGDFNTYLPDQLLAKMDVATMSCSLEARSPLLDKALIEYAAKIPTHLRLKGYTTKYLLKRLTARYVPPEVIYRRKQGFIMPLTKWLRGELAGYVQATLRSPTFRQRGWFQPAQIDHIVQAYYGGQSQWEQTIWTIFVLEIWARMNLDDSLTRHDSLDALMS